MSADLLAPRSSAVASLARLALLTLALGGGVLMLSPAFQGAEAVLGLDDKQAHGAAFFVFTLLAFAAAPHLRRTDIALAAVALGAAVEIAQGLTGRSASLGDLAADGLGVGAAWLATCIESSRISARAGLPGRRRSDRVVSSGSVGPASI